MLKAMQVSIKEGTATVATIHGGTLQLKWWGFHTSVMLMDGNGQPIALGRGIIAAPAPDNKIRHMTDCRYFAGLALGPANVTDGDVASLSNICRQLHLYSDKRCWQCGWTDGHASTCANNKDTAKSEYERKRCNVCGCAGPHFDSCSKRKDMFDLVRIKS